MSTDTWIETDTVDDCLCIKTLYLSVCIKLIEIRHAKSKICVSEKLNSLSFLQAHEQGRNILLDCTFLKKRSECTSSLLKVVACNRTDCSILLIECIYHLRITHDDTRRIEVIIQSHALAKELRREQKAELTRSIPSLLLEHLSILNVKRTAISHRNSTLDDHSRIRINLKHEINHILDMVSIKEVLLRIIVGRSRNDNELRITISRCTIKSRNKV